MSSGAAAIAGVADLVEELNSGQGELGRANSGAAAIAGGITGPVMCLAIDHGGGRRGPRRQPSGSPIAAPITGEVDHVRSGQVRRCMLTSTNELGSRRRSIDAQWVGGDDVRLEVASP